MNQAYFGGSPHRRFPLMWHILIGLTLLMLLAGCRGKVPAPTATPEAPAAETALAAGDSQSAADIEAAAGGSVALRDGAAVTIPPQALSDKTTVTLQAADAPPAAPIPRSQMGRAYDIRLAGGELTGVAIVKLPLPRDISVDQYSLAPYRWTGQRWERVNGRALGGSIQFGISGPGLFTLQGQWNLAEAALALVKPETPAGQPKIPLAVAGQYRYTALPMLEGGVVQARLQLKQDTSGGAGRVSGNDGLDQTVAEATLLFKPDPNQAQGLIEFSHVFEVAPGTLVLAPGDTTRFYASLTVSDSAAPTRRLSSGIEYAQVLPILATGTEIVRPVLATEGQRDLRWHIRLNGQTFRLEPAVAPTLPFNSILAQGGLGEYRFTLEAAKDGAWLAVSNDVTVLLTLPSTPTPLPDQPPAAGTEVAVAIPIPGSPDTTPTGGPPATPTRRPTPSGGGPVLTATPTPNPVVAALTPTSIPTRPSWASVFWADRYALVSGECTTLHWEVENVISVLYNNNPAEGTGHRQECPTQTTTYVLRVTSATGTQDRTITITVSESSVTAIEFSADSYQIVKGECTTLHWRVTNVRAVYLNNTGVAGEDAQQVCPETDTDYVLRVESVSGASSTRQLTIRVAPVSTVTIHFWAEQYTLAPGICTTLYWNVQGASAVYGTFDGAEEGITGTGSRQVCPPAEDQFYTLRVIDRDGAESLRELTLVAATQELIPTEVIAQGVVNEIMRNTDPNQPGYQVRIDGINPLFVGTPGWSQSVVTIRVPEALTTLNYDGPVHWPLNPNQQVEFRAICEGNACVLQVSMNSYLFLRSE